MSRTNPAIHKLRGVADIDSWQKTAPFPYDTMRSAPDTSFDENRNPGSAPSYQWYTKIEVACQNFRSALVEWRKCNEELYGGFRNNLVKTKPAQSNCTPEPHASRDLWDRRPDARRRWNRPVVQIPTFLDIGVSLIRPYSCITRILPYPVVSCRILLYPAVSCRILPYPAVSCRILPYLLYSAVSCFPCRILLYASNQNRNPNPNPNLNRNSNLEFQLLVKVS